MTTACMIIAVSFLPFFEAKNTVANYIVEPPGEGAERVDAVRPDLTVTEKCPACMGKGEITLEEQDFGQATGRLGGLRKKHLKCPVCKGAKKMEAYASPSSLAIDVTRDREKFQSEHLSKGDVPVGEAFIPREKYEELTERKDKERLKLVKETFGQPCRTCNWTGIEPCKKCDGNGFIKCPNDDCKGGWAVTKTTTSYSRTKSGGGLNGGSGNWRSSSGSRSIKRKEEKVSVNVCPDCGGATTVPCPVCLGRRAAPCRKCNGVGSRKKGY